MRIKLLEKLTLLLFSSLILILGYNQILKGPYYSRLSRNNRIKLVRLAAERGSIYDRYGKVLADTKLIFNASILPQEVTNIQQVINKISPVLGISSGKLLREYKKNRLAPFIPVVIAPDISKETAIILECEESDIPGLIIEAKSQRNYPGNKSLSHILGYMGKISEEELPKEKTYGSQLQNKLTGKSGLENFFEQYLKGEDGGMQIEVNNRGHFVQVLGERPAKKGQDIYLTIDSQLQKYIEQLLEEHKGVCIVMNPNNGQILSMVSKPDFDPNLFIAATNGKLEAQNILQKILNSKDAPLLDRAVSASFAPGSIFKIIVGCAGLESGKISVTDKIFCPGSLEVGNRKFFCWKHDGHGEENIHTAIAHSCNVFFYTLGLSLGADKISSFARKFTLGQPAGIELPYENPGLVPSRSWKLQKKKAPWYTGDTANFAIGQGYVLTTPLQMAKMVSAIANGGTLIHPHLVTKIGEKPCPLSEPERLAFKKTTLQAIREGMRQAVQREDGTAHKAEIADVQWAAKTGTAQTSSESTHAWFTGFYPFETPSIVVLVFLEEGGSGGHFPALIARQIVEYIRTKDITGDNLENF
ncbi:MAG: penicillin-binding protein 2 [Candidatus Omnitrophota bacterium]